MLTQRTAVILMGLSVLASACGGGGDGGGTPGPSGSGGVDLMLTAPSGRSDAIAMVRLDGGSMDSVTSIPGQRHVVGTPGVQLHVLIRAPIAGSTRLVRVCVKDIGDDGTWPSATLIQIAGGAAAGYAYRQTSEYQVSYNKNSIGKKCP